MSEETVQAVRCCCCKNDITEPGERDRGEFHSCGNYERLEKIKKCECGRYRPEDWEVKCLACGMRQKDAGTCSGCAKLLDVCLHLHCRECGNCMNSGRCACR